MGAMSLEDQQYVLNHVSRIFSRTNQDERHNYGQYQAGNNLGRYWDPWRLPIVDSYDDGKDREASYRLNRVTFCFHGPNAESVNVFGTFTDTPSLYPLTKFDKYPLFAATFIVPKMQVHTYKFQVDGKFQIDPINPQIQTLETGKKWSRFFTQGCAQPIMLGRKEMEILGRLTAHILPFRTAEALEYQRLQKYFDDEFKGPREPGTYRMDQSVGTPNFIDKLLATSESHYLDDYQICLRQIDGILRRRFPGTEPYFLEKEVFEGIYAELASGKVDGWNPNTYGDPRYFLKILRRHTLTGAFSHPKYGGNSDGMGWSYLEEVFRGPSGETLFDWRSAMEWPLGNDKEYFG